MTMVLYPFIFYFAFYSLSGSILGASDTRRMHSTSFKLRISDIAAALPQSVQETTTSALVQAAKCVDLARGRRTGSMRRNRQHEDQGPEISSFTGSRASVSASGWDVEIRQPLGNSYPGSCAMLIKYEFQRICFSSIYFRGSSSSRQEHHPSYRLILVLAWNPSYATFPARHHSPTRARVYIQQDTMIQYYVRRFNHHSLPIQPIAASAPATCPQEPLSTLCRRPRSRTGHP